MQRACVIFFAFISLFTYSQEKTKQIMLYLDNDDLEKAEKEIKFVFATDTISPDYLFCVARLERKKGRYLTSSKYFLRYMQFDSAKACNGMSILHAINKEYKPALDYINISLRIDPKNADYLNTRASIYYSQSKYDAAVADFQKAILIDSLNDHAYYNLGLTYNSLNRYREAIASYDKAISLRPANFKGYFERGLSNLYYYKYERAIADFKECLKYKDKVNYGEYVSEGSVYHYISEAYKGLNKYFKYKSYARKAKRKGWTGLREDLV